MILPPTDTHFKPQDWDTYQLDRWTTALDHTPRRRRFVDVGAHVGIFSHRGCEAFEWVDAYEPVWIDYWQQNMLPWRNHTLYPYPASSDFHNLSMTIHTDNSGATEVTLGRGKIYEGKPIDWTEHGDVDLIKLDCQNWEYPALLGARVTIEASWPTLIVEIEPDNPHQQELHNLIVVEWGYEQVYRKNADRIFAKKG